MLFVSINSKIYVKFLFCLNLNKIKRTTKKKLWIIFGEIKKIFQNKYSPTYTLK